MQYQGKLVQWNDERGFGFVEPTGGGNRSFVHIKAFTETVKRPENGDVIIYTERKEGPNKFKALNVRYAHSSTRKIKKASKNGKNDRGYGSLFIFGYFVAMGVAIMLGRLPAYILFLPIGLSIVCFIYYAIDKRAAHKNQWRVPEKTLHLLALFGGWPGAILGQKIFRHKTSKASFQFEFRLTIIFNIVGLIMISFFWDFLF